MTNEIADVYNYISRDFSETRYSHWKGVKKFLDNIPSYSLVADCGTGNGKYLNYRKDLMVIGNDISSKLASIAKYNKNITNEVILANCINLPYKSKCFDHTISIAVLHHLSSKESHILFIKELIRITNKSLLITVWALEQNIKSNWKHVSNHDYLIPWNLGYNKIMRPYHLFSKDELDDILKEINCKYNLSYEMDNWFININLI